MQYFETIAAYYKTFGHTPPKAKNFDVRSFQQYYEEEHTQLPVFNMAPFRVEFYGIGLVEKGTAKKHLGQPFDANLIFYSPYQVLSFEGVDRNWQGYYILFSQDFLDQCTFGADFLEDFPFLRLDNVHPIKLSDDAVDQLLPVFRNILTEFESGKKDKFKLIEIYLNLLLHLIRREVADISFSGTDARNKTEINLIAQYQSLIERTLSKKEDLSSAHFSPAWYAEQLNIHPNYLNAMAKRATRKTAKQLILDLLVHHAKSLLLQSDLSVKEIAFRLGFEEPAHFNNLFKKNTSLTPAQYRKANL